MRMPSNTNLDIAIIWLESNEGDGQEGEACKAVAAWIEHKRTEREIRSRARADGVPTAEMRRRLVGGH